MGAVGASRDERGISSRSRKGIGQGLIGGSNSGGVVARDRAVGDVVRVARGEGCQKRARPQNVQVATFRGAAYRRHDIYESHVCEARGIGLEQHFACSILNFQEQNNIAQSNVS